MQARRSSIIPKITKVSRKSDKMMIIRGLNSSKPEKKLKETCKLLQGEKVCAARPNPEVASSLYNYS